MSIFTLVLMSRFVWYGPGKTATAAAPNTFSNVSLHHKFLCLISIYQRSDQYLKKV